MGNQQVMSNSIGKNVILTVWGESHGPSVGVVLDGMAPGIEVSEQEIADFLSLRRPKDSCSTARQEPDNFQILSGVFNGYTTGAPICIAIPNSDVRSQDYKALQCVARPSHADYVAHVKYGGFEDYRGGGHFSGRVTAGIVAAGAIACKALSLKGITVGTHILKCGTVSDLNALDIPVRELDSKVAAVSRMDFPLFNPELEPDFMAQIQSARRDGDSVGGVAQTIITGLPVGVGEPWFESLEGNIAKAVFAIGGVKGVEFGLGFGFSQGRASQLNDPFGLENGKVITKTNNNGGINGGISNGMPVIFNTAVKPTPSISQSQDTVNYREMKQQTISITGRHDPAILRRIPLVLTSMTAIVLCDLLSTKS